MIFLRFILGVLFLGTVIGIVFAVLLASNHREQTLHFLAATKATALNFFRKLHGIFRPRQTV